MVYIMEDMKNFCINFIQDSKPQTILDKKYRTHQIKQENYLNTSTPDQDFARGKSHHYAETSGASASRRKPTKPNSITMKQSRFSANGKPQRKRSNNINYQSEDRIGNATWTRPGKLKQSIQPEERAQEPPNSQINIKIQDRRTKKKHSLTREKPLNSSNRTSRRG